METNLPELCRRVYAKVPAARPQNNEWQMEDHFQVTSKYDGGQYSHAFSCQEHLIQAAALRWLLDESPVGFSMYKSTLGAFLLGDTEANDLTTCLLLAVERCHEYKESSK
jgi:hypothetical protein